jgi:hypothetical protein
MKTTFAILLSLAPALAFANGHFTKQGFIKHVSGQDNRSGYAHDELARLHNRAPGLFMKRGDGAYSKGGEAYLGKTSRSRP